jgi:hypothetical protein
MISWHRHCVRVAAALFALGCLSSRGFAAEHAIHSSSSQVPTEKTGKNVRDRDENAVTADQTLCKTGRLLQPASD